MYVPGNIRYVSTGGQKTHPFEHSGGTAADLYYSVDKPPFSVALALPTRGTLSGSEYSHVHVCE
eukprot:3509320-Rhodomonas_salina.1